MSQLLSFSSVALSTPDWAKDAEQATSKLTRYEIKRLLLMGRKNSPCSQLIIVEPFFLVIRLLPRTRLSRWYFIHLGSSVRAGHTWHFLSSVSAVLRYASVAMLDYVAWIQSSTPAL